MYYVPLVLGIIMNIVSGNYVRERAEERLLQPYNPLPDIIHDYFRKIPLIVPDVFLLFCILLLVYEYPYILDFEKNVFTIGICTMIRSFSVCLTTMPTCMVKPSGNNNLYSKCFLNTHDLMFSGHSLFFIGIGKMMNSFIIATVGPFLLVIARQHYTIDVCVSFLVYFFVETQTSEVTFSN